MRLWENNIRRVTPYVPGEQPEYENMIKLNTNENPYPPAPGVGRALKELDSNLLRLYPDPSASGLVECLADYLHVKKEQVFVGVGSDDVLAMAFLTFFNSNKPILFPNITYSFYEVWADLFRIPFRTPSVDEGFRMKKTDYFAENGGIVIANPNAPTSIAEPRSFLEEIVANNQDSVVIVDEAYVDFGAESMLPLINQYDNLLVVQTFSKSRSMAGMRIGFAVGNEALIKAMQNVKFSYNSYTMNQISLILGVEAVKDEAYFKAGTNKIIETRKRVMYELASLGFVFPESKTNFIFATHPKVSAKRLYEVLRAEHIFVRYFNKPLIDNYLRITIGTDEEMDTFISFVKNYIH